MKKLVGEGHFFEGARWHSGAWWASDLYARRVLRITSSGSVAVVTELETQPSGLGWLPDDDLLIASMQDRCLWRMGRNGALRIHAQLASHTGGWINDMVVDRNGRAFVGNFGFDLWAGAAPKAASLVRVDPDGSVHNAADDLLFPNGIVVSADGRTLIVAETFGNRMTAFNIQDDGSLSDRRTWAKFGAVPSWATVSDFLKVDLAPDGCAIDADGCIWVADALHNRVCRIAEGGQILSELRAPSDAGIYSCALGGDDGRTLLICTAPDYDPNKRKAKREAILYGHTVDVPAVS